MANVILKIEVVETVIVKDLKTGKDVIRVHAKVKDTKRYPSGKTEEFLLPVNIKSEIQLTAGTHFVECRQTSMNDEIYNTIVALFEPNSAKK